MDSCIECPVEAKRGTPRVAEKDGCTYVLPAVVHVDKSHALANRESFSSPTPASCRFRPKNCPIASAPRSFAPPSPVIAPCRQDAARQQPHRPA